MRRLMIAGVLSASLAGCSSNSAGLTNKVPTVLADGVEIVVLKLPAMV